MPRDSGTCCRRRLAQRPRRPGGLRGAERAATGARHSLVQLRLRRETDSARSRAGKVPHISYTKGCYTGQEIVERVRSRGQVNRRRVELLFSGEGVPENGANLTVDDKPAGFVTRAAQSWFPPGILGMGYLGKERRSLGTTLQWSGGTATVVESRKS